MSNQKLSAQQQRFVDEYIIDKNAKAAYIRAGYKARGNSAEANASALIRSHKVKSAIDKRLAVLAKRCDISAERVLSECARLAFSDPRAITNPNGSLKQLHELDEDTARAISSVKVKPDGSVEYKFWDKNSAQERLAKHLGLFERDNAQKNALAALTDDVVSNRLAALLGKVGGE